MKICLMISEKSGGDMGGKGSGRHWRWDAKSTVESQREADYYRSARKAEKIIKRLGWNDNGFSDFDEEKPKGMHWHTYEHLIDQFYRFKNDSLNSAVMQFRK